jgi:uncharacterized protein YndB with AHSA1/START domain
VNMQTLVVRRLIRAPREVVFAAWLEPASLAKWMRPGDVTAVTAEVDPRVGGRFRIVMTHGRGDGEHHGEYLEIERPSRLVFTWISSNTDNLPTVVTVEFLDRGTDTEIVLTHRGLPPNKIDAHETGWTEIMRRLDDALSTGLGR